MSKVTHKLPRKVFASSNVERVFLYKELTSFCLGKKKNPRREWKIEEEIIEGCYSNYYCTQRATKLELILVIEYLTDREDPAFVEWVVPYSNCPFLQEECLVYGVGYTTSDDKEEFIFSLDTENTTAKSINIYESRSGLLCVGISKDKITSNFIAPLNQPLLLRVYEVGNFLWDIYLGEHLILQAKDLAEDSYEPHWILSEVVPIDEWVHL